MLDLEKLQAMTDSVRARRAKDLEEALACCATPFERVTTTKVFELAWRQEALERALAGLP